MTRREEDKAVQALAQILARNYGLPTAYRVNDAKNVLRGLRDSGFALASIASAGKRP